MAKVKLSEELFKKKATFDINGRIYKVGMMSPKGVFSHLNASKQETSKINWAFHGMYHIFHKKNFSVYNLDRNPCSYMELETTFGKTRAFVSYHGNDCFDILTDELKPGESEIPYMSYIVAAVYYNDIINIDLEQDGMDHALCTKDFKVPISMLESNGLDANNENYAFCACDWFYYAIGKNFEADIIHDTNRMDMEIQRMNQNGMYTHVDTTLESSAFDVSAVKKPANNVVKKSKKTDIVFYTEPLETFFNRCKNGEFIIDYQWSDTQKKYLVPLDFLNTFFPTETFRRLLLSVWYQINANLKMMRDGVPYTEIMSRNPINIKIMGKPGSGKTTVIEAVLAALGYPKGLINCKDRMEEDELEGMNKFINGTIYNIPTKAGELHSVGGAILLEEMNLPDPGILQGSLGQALAYPFVLKVDGYREFVRHPLTIYFGTLNVGTIGSKPMNEALSSRFPEGHILEDVSKDEFVEILHAAGYRKYDCNSVYRVYMGIINYLRKNREDLVLSVTLRHCLSALDKMKIGFSKELAYEMTFVSQLYSSDPEVAANIKKDVISNLI